MAGTSWGTLFGARILLQAEGWEGEGCDGAHVCVNIEHVFVSTCVLKTFVR